jgi:hypothetical protein
MMGPKGHFPFKISENLLSLWKPAVKKKSVKNSFTIALTKNLTFYVLPVFYYKTS